MQVDDEIYRMRNDNGCPYHTVRCNLTPDEVRETLRIIERVKDAKSRQANPRTAP
jgi:hypothetical protein